jgi:hypothetical protein
MTPNAMALRGPLIDQSVRGAGDQTAACKLAECIFCHLARGGGTQYDRGQAGQTKGPGCCIA